MPSGVNVPASSVSARDDRAAAATIDDSRPRAIEVHALFEDTIIAVACLANPHGGRASRATKALFAAGAAALMIPIVSFVVAYVDVPRVRAWDDWNRANHAHNAFVLPLGGFAIDIAAALFGVAAVVLLVVAALRWASERTARDFTIGSGRDALVHAPVEQLPLASFPLVHAVGDDYSLSFTAHMSGDVTLADGQSASLAQLVESGAARASHDLGDAWSWPIPRDAHACIRLMHTTFHVTSVEPPRVYELARAIDWQTQVYTLVTGLSVLLFLFMVNRIPGAPRSLSLDPFLHETRFARFLVRPPDEPSMAIPAWLREHASSGNQGLQSSRQVKTGAGERQKGSSKGATAHAVTMTAVERHNAKQLAEEQANNAGVVGLFKSYEGTHFGGVARDLALGPDADTVLSGLTARDVDAYGNGGTSVVASGKGAGGTGDSTIAGGTLDTIGKGAHGGRSDYGRGAGGPLGNHRLAALPGVVPGTANVRGALDKEIIRRVVRRHLNEVKFCYEKALIRKSSLSGRVTMQFTIGANGRVLASIVQSSTLNDREVEQCLQAAVSRWEFPQPNGGGIVIVSYPLVLKYADL